MGSYIYEDFMPTDGTDVKVREGEDEMAESVAEFLLALGNGESRISSTDIM